MKSSKIDVENLLNYYLFFKYRHHHFYYMIILVEKCPDWCNKIPFRHHQVEYGLQRVTLIYAECVWLFLVCHAFNTKKNSLILNELIMCQLRQSKNENDANRLTYKILDQAKHGRVNDKNPARQLKSFRKKNRVGNSCFVFPGDLVSLLYDRAGKTCWFQCAANLITA